MRAIFLSLLLLSGCATNPMVAQPAPQEFKAETIDKIETHSKLDSKVTNNQMPPWMFLIIAGLLWCSHPSSITKVFTCRKD